MFHVVALIMILTADSQKPVMINYTDHRAAFETKEVCISSAKEVLKPVLADIEKHTPNMVRGEVRFDCTDQETEMDQPAPQPEPDHAPVMPQVPGEKI